MTLRKLILGTAAALLLAIGPAAATEADNAAAAAAAAAAVFARQQRAIRAFNDCLLEHTRDFCMIEGIKQSQKDSCPAGQWHDEMINYPEDKVRGLKAFSDRVRWLR